jgi:hypothetical protein
MPDPVSRILHPDLPPLVGGLKSWDLPVPLDDFASALESPSIQPADAGGISLDMVKTVERYSVNYHGADWKPGDTGGTELGLFAVGTLMDGRWFSVEAWNDYTGWGCQDGSDVYIGATEADVVANGVTNDGRSALGYPEVTA